MNPTENIGLALGIAAVERDTGIAKDTLRVWERRYGFPDPRRDENGERLYPPEQVERLRLIRRLLDQGRRPAAIVSQSADALRGELDALEAAQPAVAANPGLLKYVRLHRGNELAAAMRQRLLKQGLQRFVIETVAPLNVAVGEAWMRGEIDVPEEHLYTEQVQNVLRSAIATHVASHSRPSVLLTTFPDEEHVLGLLMVEAILATEGIGCVSLGTRTPLADIQRAAAEGHFDVVGLSFSAAYATRQALEGLKQLRTALPDSIALWAGGASLAGRHRSIPGVRFIRSLDDVLDALAQWRTEHA